MVSSRIAKVGLTMHAMRKNTCALPTCTWEAVKCPYGIQYASICVMKVFGHDDMANLEAILRTSIAEGQAANAPPLEKNPDYCGRHLQYGGRYVQSCRDCGAEKALQGALLSFQGFTESCPIASSAHGIWDAYLDPACICIAESSLQS